MKPSAVVIVVLLALFGLFGWRAWLQHDLAIAAMHHQEAMAKAEVERLRLLSEILPHPHHPPTKRGLEMNYELRTLKDVFDKVPANRIMLCMQEIGQAMAQAKATKETLEAMADASASTVEVAWPESCTWLDDDEGEVTLRYRFEAEVNESHSEAL